MFSVSNYNNDFSNILLGLIRVLERLIEINQRPRERDSLINLISLSTATSRHIRNYIQNIIMMICKLIYSTKIISNLSLVDRWRMLR